MHTFTCRCGARLFFDNTQCLTCRRQVGFAPGPATMLALGGKTGLMRRYRRCDNAKHGVCNWLVEAGTGSGVCASCALDQTTPDLSVPVERARFREVEEAKRRLLYSLHKLGLPVTSKERDPERGLAFEMKSARPGEKVVTGHNSGLITIDVTEADAPERERTRLAMKERYRTLLGHFRHEIGHYYWFLLVQDSASIEAFREHFGDERADYAQALRIHYRGEAPRGNLDDFISAYAASHPWEDFAETFAHYLHMVDTLETASDFRLTEGWPPDPAADPFESLLSAWYGFSVALNSVNRSMGYQDAYPFTVGPGVKRKLRFIHEVIVAAAREERKIRKRAWSAPFRWLGRAVVAA